MAQSHSPQPWLYLGKKGVHSPLSVDHNMGKTLLIGVAALVVIVNSPVFMMA
jgi:hypothetical protein